MQLTNHILVRLRDGRHALRVQSNGRAVNLSVPHMGRGTPREIRIEVFDLVLRRDYPAAAELAREWNQRTVAALRPHDLRSPGMPALKRDLVAAS